MVIIMRTQSILDIYGSKVFTHAVMKKVLPAEVYSDLMRTIEEGMPLTIEIADAVAEAMKNWAVNLGATHYSHWFQPLTGITAEKHDSFISPSSDGRVILEFSGKALFKGEPDASSFPNGGLRATFEARGYTAWDCTSPAFLKDDTLYIPTAFCSYTGEALDKKTPLLRSMEALSKQALRVLRLFDNKSAKRVIATVGAEQEYFLIDRSLYEKRMDLMLCGRTLFGAHAPKGQEMDDHYFGRIRLRVSSFMRELDEELWKLGVSSKTRHNEVAPAQHELAPVFTTANIACDHNQLTMEMMKRIAKTHGLACLLHEKPFDGVNGSGKHNNWAMATDDGQNLLEPGKTPEENAQFLIFLCAVIKGVDEYQDVLRASIASAGNDHRLGAHEAPPPIVSIFLGDELTNILECIRIDKPIDASKQEILKIGVSSLPNLPKDSTDRNRTSPFAFTGNKFEFRMCGSSASIARPCFTLNTIVAESLRSISDRLENAIDIKTEIQNIIKDVATKHSRIIYNSNNYSDEWIIEAQQRGLSNIQNTVGAIEKTVDEKNIQLFEGHGVLTRQESISRVEIHYNNYSKAINIEALTSIEIAKRQILPAALLYIGELSRSAQTAIPLVPNVRGTYYSIVEKLSTITTEISHAIEELSQVTKTAANEPCFKTRCELFNSTVLPKMTKLRNFVDALESEFDSSRWPLPSYFDLMFRV